jgi:putative NIF3 family GTP cyclohydrolase 1 type 2
MAVRIQEVIDALTAPADPVVPTVDRLEPGNPDTIVNGIAVTFLATQEIFEKAKNLGANLVISHEGIFYSHQDRREMLKGDPVYEQKSRMLDESGMAVFRFHDNIHHYHPDAVTQGLLQSLGWIRYEVENLPIASILEIPETTLKDIVSMVKNRLCLPYVRFVGNPAAPCRRVGVLVGFRGSGDIVIPFFNGKNLDLVIYGEGPEWETPEYVRDAVYQGKKKALIVLGHAESEAPGMERFADSLREKFPGLPVHYIPYKPIFQIG